MPDRNDKPVIFLDRIHAAEDAPITAITIWQRNPNLSEVHAANTVIARIRTRDIEELRGVIGTPAGQVAASLQQILAVDDARRIALSLLARRDFSSIALRERLIRRGCDETIALQVVQELISQGWIDDERYARMLAEQTAERGKATPQAIAAVLSRHRVEPADAQSAIDAVLSEVDPSDAAATIARKRLKSMSEGLPASTRTRRIMSYLARRGFDEEAILSALNRCGLSIDAEQ